MEAKRFKILCDFLEGALSLAVAASEEDTTLAKRARDVLDDPDWFNNIAPEYDSFFDASRDDFRRALEKIAGESSE